ncbi:GTP cyclohydrolase II [Nocardia sp. NPDC052566]|uniref:GTP cyclohydrolase II n=1 Tax=Nocardia sp. NPDC052566 TaxID=3364330 RepID=UPI0037C59F2B
MTAPEWSLADTEHHIIRKGKELRVQVRELRDDPDVGQLLVFGEVEQDCLVRIHSRCLYGDALGVEDCDCGPELEKAMDQIQAEGRGVLVYLEQEGRGAGLIAKARGMGHSQRCGIDTFASYEALGYEPDSRGYKLAAKSIAELGLSKVRLLTNNPLKAKALWEEGIEATVLPLPTEVRNETARRYLEAKRRRRQHWIPTDRVPWAPDLM